MNSASPSSPKGTRCSAPGWGSSNGFQSFAESAEAGGGEGGWYHQEYLLQSEQFYSYLLYMLKLYMRCGDNQPVGRTHKLFGGISHLFGKATLGRD